MTKETLYALDFDGVICDSAIETGITGWKVARQIWSDMPEHAPEEMINLFRQVRPVMETGYEAILIMRLLFECVDTQVLLNNFSSEIETIIQKNDLDTSELKRQFGEVRDRWIAENMDEWVEMNPLFNGVAEKLSSFDARYCTIITTKQERFVSRILEANDIPFPEEHIFGLDRQMSKQDVLNNLQEQHKNHTLVFVEDRLPTLHNIIADSRLSQVRCLFANWGYNTQQDKIDASKIAEIATIDLAGFISL